MTSDQALTAITAVLFLYDHGEITIVGALNSIAVITAATA